MTMTYAVCEKCGSHDVSISDTRYYEDYDYRRRRYRCNKCGHRWTRYEISAKAFRNMKLDEELYYGKVSWWSGRNRKNAEVKNGQFEE